MYTVSSKMELLSFSCKPAPAPAKYTSIWVTTSILSSRHLHQENSAPHGTSHGYSKFSDCTSKILLKLLLLLPFSLPLLWLRLSSLFLCFDNPVFSPFSRYTLDSSPHCWQSLVYKMRPMALSLLLKNIIEPSTIWNKTLLLSWRGGLAISPPLSSIFLCCSVIQNY